MTKDTGGQAFPSEITNINGINYSSSSKGTCYGMTLRDYFAGQALVSLMPIAQEKGKKEKRLISKAEMATVSYNYADAMITERNL